MWAPVLYMQSQLGCYDGTSGRDVTNRDEQAEQHQPHDPEGKVGWEGQERVHEGWHKNQREGSADGR